MTIDASAIVAIAFNEPEAARLAAAIASAPVRLMSAVNWFEAMMVIEARSGPAAAEKTLLSLSDLDVVPLAFDREQMIEAHAAWRRFGKGRHPAGLNLGDCCAYAAAVVRDEPLLYKGADFDQTGVARAIW